MDVKTAFLYREVEEETYVKQPKGKTDGMKKACPLLKSLYGLKHSARIWYRKLKARLKLMGFEPLDTGLSVFYNKDTGVIIAIYIDDLLLVGPSTQSIQKTKDELAEFFHMQGLGPCAWYLDIKSERDRPQRILQLSQLGYINKVLQVFIIILLPLLPVPSSVLLGCHLREEFPKSL
jgi:hypothetical protein